jgi:hypothetical protein
MSAWSKHPGFHNRLISLLLEKQHANLIFFPDGSSNEQFRAELKTSFLFVTFMTAILFILLYFIFQQKFII